ncbi:MAG: benzoate-CoA ligase family protein [Candidatus Promineifilaceae bacterium]|nr:benzoate-CoA ligase family protein [Candidatus Promineifilaceae bacterium]
MLPYDLNLPARYNVSEVLYHNLESGRGGKTAIFWQDQQVTYDALADTAGRIGNALIELGLEPGARVLLLLMDTPHFPAAFFGAIRAGFVPIPTNTVLNSDSYKYFLNDSGAKVAIVSGPLYPKISAIRAGCPDLKHVIVVDGDGTDGALDFEAACSSASPQLDPAPTAPGDPAFWLYSSGSTGFPKGVVHQQKNIRYTTETYSKQVIGITEEDICFSASKAFHAYGLGNNVTFPYSVGASTVMLTGRPSPDRVFATIEQFKPTLFFTVPTLYTLMLANYDGADMSSIRLCISAAEALQPEIYRQWKQKFGVDILDGIGSTEMLHIFISNRPNNAVAGSSGTPVPGYEVKIEDFEGNLVSPGEAGNLLVRGGSAAALYWNKPEKTAQTMRGEWIFTGDRYYQDNEGYYFYEGRSDDMFKVSGQWVSPIEVENILIEHPAVLECAVVMTKDASGLQRTKACIILTDGFAPEDSLTSELQTFVKARLAPYKYPRIIQYVDELPKTATGKIQRFKLRDP